MDATPTLLTAPLNPKVLVPGAAATPAAATLKPAAAFLQVLAATTPTDAETTKTAPAQVAEIALSAASSMPANVAADDPQIALKSSGTLQPAGVKHGKKSPQTNAETGLATAAQPSVAASAAVAIPAPRAPALGAPQIAASTLAPPLAAGSVTASLSKADPAIVLDAPKQNPSAAAPAKPVSLAAATTEISPNALSALVSHPAPVLNVTAKTADIIKQIATALPLASLAHSQAGPGLHISLTPETLGAITVKISQHISGETTVVLSASQPETLAALKHDTQNLHQILTNAGVPEANRQLDFKTMPVAAAQISAGLGDASGQSANTGGQPGQGDGSGQQQQTGTGFANFSSKPVATPVANNTTRPVRSTPNGKVDVIA